LSAVTPAQFKSFTREQQMAFLINAYNGFTLKLASNPVLRGRLKEFKIKFTEYDWGLNNFNP
jgi:hypothetical protein